MEINKKFSIPIRTLLVFILLCSFIGSSHSSAEMNLKNSSYVNESSILNDPQDRYSLVNFGIREIGPTLYLNFKSQKKIYYTQVFNGEINIHKNHKQIEKIGKWNLIPSDTSINQEKNYIIAISEVYVNDKIYTVIVQTYDNESEIFGDSYLKEEILDFTKSLNIEYAIKKFL